MGKKWYSLEYETLEWKPSYDLKYLSRQQKSLIKETYESSIPDFIFKKNISLPGNLEARISDVLVNLARFDMEQAQKGYTFPLMLLRSESAASSQIENLTSSVRNISMAEISEKAPANAKIISNNVKSMRSALSIEGSLSVNSIKEIHKELMGNLTSERAGEIREEAVWIGGSSFSPHNSIFVPPHFTRLSELLKDLVQFSERFDLNPIIKAAILHAQFETIHPFTDGNGRTGRALIHKSLKDDGVLQNSTLPISAGLLNSKGSYMDAILEFQKGNPLAIILELTSAIEKSLIIGNDVSEKVSLLLNEWESRIFERKTSSIYKLLYLLIEQPVISSKYLAEKLEITHRGANMLIKKAVDYGVLERFGTEKRGVYYQARDVIEIMSDVSDNAILRRQT